MTVSSTPNRFNPLASGTASSRSAGSARGLFVAVAVLGLGGAAAGWLLTHKSETPDAGVTPAQGSVVDPLAQGANGAGAGTEIITPATATTDPAKPLGAPNPMTPDVLGTTGQRVQQATAMIAADPVRARAELTRLLDGNQLTTAERMAAYQGINTVAEQVFFSPRIVPGDTVSQSYMVKKGDSLARIAKHENLGVDWRFVQRVNALPNERALHPNLRLKLPYGPFNVEVVKSDYRLNLYAGQGEGRIMVASFPCGLGENDGTPTGTFKVRTGSKLIDPQWRNPRTGEFFASNDPRNPIGERWIGLQGSTPETTKFTGYGIHGTVDQQSIGKQVSMGCVRLGDAEVQVVYELVSEASTVVIR